MTKWLLAPGILAASAVHAHAAVGVALPLPVFLIVFAIFIGAPIGHRGNEPLRRVVV